MNPAYTAAIAILVAIACIFFVFRFGKNFFKLLTFLLFVIVLCSVILGAFVVSDAMNFKEGISKESNLFVLRQDDKMLAGVVLKPLFKTTGTDIYKKTLVDASSEEIKEVGNLKTREEEEQADIPFRFISGSQFNDFSSAFAEGDIGNLSSSFYKVFIFDDSIFSEIKDGFLNLGSVELSVSDALESLKSDQPIVFIAQKLSEEEGYLQSDVEEQIKAGLGEDVRGAVFALLLNKLFGEELRDLTPIIEHFKKGGIEVYPDAFMFKIAKLIPEPLIDIVVNVRGE